MKFIVPLLIFTLVFPMGSFSNPPESTPGPNEEETIKPQVAPLVKGQIAPFTGTLFNNIATAEILAEKEFAQIECSLRIKHAVDKEKARCSLLINSTNASFQSLQDRYKAILVIKDKEIDRLSKLALEGSNSHVSWWATGGFLVGAAVTIGMFFIVAETMDK